ncbi:MAG: FprA family A-type flavoprotein [Candidatus Margulisbacteria bacterium]|nr:FprA family A-type flavoprotein [Candidatus Margulisiibacteriota bacterium]MBU1617029.1 FprA family A-type flavoprotein [Candidatus Margulisiibacteriota bacterium]
MAVRRLKDKIFEVGAIDFDRRLFDELIPLPEGTSYNSYLVQGSDKTALLDTVDPAKVSSLVENLNELSIEKIDYIIAHHAEQDHSGSLPFILELFPMAKVVTNAKCKEMLISLLLLPEEKFIVINDREILSLGDKTLEFIFAPWVHWPETMLTYLKEDKILFTCDFFGSHLAAAPLFVTDQPHVLRSAKRYYAEIMMPFRTSIKQHLEKLKTVDFTIIAPSHGPVYDQPEMIMDAYADWAGDQVKNEVVLPYVSMHGSTQEMVEYLINALIARGIVVKPYNLSRTDIGELAMDLVDAATIVIGTPTVLVGPHPLAAYAALLANALRPKTKFASIIGSFSWGGKMVEMLSAAISNLKVTVIEPVIAKGAPREAEYAALDNLADEIKKSHQAAGIV